MIELESIPIKEILLVTYGGLFGWTLSKMPNTYIYVILAIAILLTILVVL